MHMYYTILHCKTLHMDVNNSNFDETHDHRDFVESNKISFSVSNNPI